MEKEGWRDWRDDVESYMDTLTPGIKMVLKEAALEKEEIGEMWYGEKMGKYAAKADITQAHQVFYRAHGSSDSSL